MKADSDSGATLSGSGSRGCALEPQSVSTADAAPIPGAGRAEMIERMKHAVEGECDGLAIDDAHAAAILDYVLGAA